MIKAAVLNYSLDYCRRVFIAPVSVFQILQISSFSAHLWVNPSWPVLAQTQYWKHYNKAWNLFKVIKKTPEQKYLKKMSVNIKFSLNIKMRLNIKILLNIKRPLNINKSLNIQTSSECKSSSERKSYFENSFEKSLRIEKLPLDIRIFQWIYKLSFAPFEQP